MTYFPSLEKPFPRKKSVLETSQILVTRNHNSNYEKKTCFQPLTFAFLLFQNEEEIIRDWPWPNPT